MRIPGIIGTVQLAMVSVFALPLIVFGLDWLIRGRPLGAVFVGIGALMFALQHILRNPFDPLDIAETAIDRTTDNEE
jgi:hypothetical protein